MTRPTKSLDPDDRMGVYKRLSDVPDRYRFSFHEESYEGRDVWQEFCDDYEHEQGTYGRYEKEVDLVGDHWKTFMTGRGRHHALATPKDVESWCSDLLSEMSTRRSHDYFLRVRRFYDWLQWHTEHLHVYNPALMAAAEGEAAGEVWEYNVRRTRERRERYREKARTIND